MLVINHVNISRCNYNGHNIDLYDVDVVRTTIFELQEIVVNETGIPLGYPLLNSL